MWEKIRVIFLVVGVVALSMGTLGVKMAIAEDADEYKASDDLLKVIPSSKHSLDEGIKQATQGAETPISAKFEMDDGKLSLSVYTVDTKTNTFKEVAGAPDAPTWTPSSEVIKGGEDLETAQNQWKVLSASKLSLLDFIAKAQKDLPGTILSVMPEIEDGKNVCEVRVVNQGKVTEIHYDVVSGTKAGVE